MKKFRFKLASVLRVKKVVEAEKQRVFAEAQQKVVEREEQISQNRQAMERTREHLATLQRDELDVKEILSHQRYINSLRVANERLERELVGLRRTAQERRQELVQASKERRTLERLEEKQRETWHREYETQERKQLDEMGLMRRPLQPGAPAPEEPTR